MVPVAWAWLEHHLSLFSADGEAEAVAGCREAVHLGLHFLLFTGVDCAVVSEEKVSGTVSFTLVAASSLLGLNSFPYVLNVMLMPGLLSPKASVSLAESIRLNSVGARTQP